MFKYFIFSILCFKGMAFVSTDTAVLMELVTTTASQLNELEKLVSNAERYTERMQKYNELAQDEYFRAERVSYLAESLASKKEIEDLGGLNSAISDLKNSMSDMKSVLDEYKEIQGQEETVKAKSDIKIRQNDKKKNIASKQVSRALQGSTNSGVNRINAQNTAMILEETIEVQNNQLTMIDQNATTNRLLAEDLEIKRKNEISKKLFYGGRDGK